MKLKCGGAVEIMEGYSENEVQQLEVDELKSGMRLAEDIENNFGGILLPESAVLTGVRIKRLKANGYRNVKVYKESPKKYDENIKKLSAKERAYREDVQKAARLYKRMKYEEKIDIEEFEELAENTMDLSLGLEVDELLSMMRKVEEYTYTHLINVGVLGSMLGRWLDLKKDRIKNMVKAGLLHDIGKAKIDEKILKKPDILNNQEFEEIKKHARHG